MKKQKVINVTYRKDSVTFSDWMKYEITLIDEKGKTQVIPAYGKDLQDALSRVVHDKRVVEVEKTTKRIPDIVWAALWFGYMIGLAEYTTTMTNNSLKGFVFVSGTAFITGLTLWVKAWFRMRNIDKVGK